MSLRITFKDTTICIFKQNLIGTKIIGFHIVYYLKIRQNPYYL